MAFISRYIYSNCTTLAIGCTLYSNDTLTAVYASKQITITTGGFKKVYSTMSSGAIVSISTCSWTSQSSANIYNPIYTGFRNNCGNSGTGSTINVNDGGAYSFAGTSSPIVSYVSQADADSQAQTIAQANFNSGIQNYINNNASCTWTYNNGSATYPATNYTRNNCGANCDAGSVQYQAVSKSGYSATSTLSYQNAIDTANGYAYSAAQSESQSLGQAYANTYGACCCWVSDTCNGCTYMANRQRNLCTSAYRYETVTESNSCSCNVNCQGTNYTNNRCVGADLKDRQYYEIYNCNGSETGASYTVDCGCDLRQPSLVSTGYTTCSGCQNVTIFRDTGNRCSLTYNEYYVNGVSTGSTTMPSTASCNTTPSYTDDLGIKCVGGSNYNVLGNVTACGNYRYKYYNGNETNYTNNYSTFNDACSFSAYRSETFTRNNCGSGYTGGNVFFDKTYYYSGVNNQSGAEALADANFSTEGQSYANIYGSCTATPTCYTYNIISNNDNVYVDGQYTTCGGYTDYFSFYSSSSYTNVGSVCARSGSVYVTANGFENQGGTC